VDAVAVDALGDDPRRSTADKASLYGPYARYVRLTETSRLQQDEAINGLLDHLVQAVRSAPAHR